MNDSSKTGESSNSHRRLSVGNSIQVLAHHKRGIALRFAQFRATGISAFAAFIAVLGPGLLAGLSDDDPAGITTYSVLGTDHGYQFNLCHRCNGFISPRRTHFTYCIVNLGAIYHRWHFG